ncbi:MAG: hypothetical protein KKB70_09215 [Proteobacteria bacterium]|nr:hypothetical protein [Pseudomonadota bacterium]MBU1610941.1 hypothetical protein [Pseudomonadota bacterium]
MRKMIVVVVLMVSMLSTGVVFAEEAPQKIKDLATSELAAYGTDAGIIAAVKAQNAKGITLDAIKAKDEQWKGDAGLADYMKAIVDGSCGPQIRAMQKSKPYYAEIFVMDNQGANVCMTDKTSDYWQGDEAKFQKSFAGSAGAVFVDEVEFDDSSQSYLVQVSVPVIDGGKAIGAITFGIDVDKVQ